MLAKKSKKFLSLLLALCLVLGLLPLSVLAAETDPLTPKDLYYNVKGETTTSANAAVTLSKTAQRTAADEWQVTLNAKVNNIAIEQQPLEVTFVLDVSGSMAWCSEEHTHDASCGPLKCGFTEEHTHNFYDCYSECTRTNHPSHWGGNYWDGYYHKSGTDCTPDFFDNYYYFSCPKTEHTHVDSCYSCGKAEHNHSGLQGGVACSNVTAGSPSRLASAKAAITSMLTALRAKAGTDKITAKFVIFSSSDYANGVNKSGKAKVINESQLAQVTAKGGTMLSAGVEKGIDQFKSSSARQVLVVVADGDSNDGYPSTKATNFKNNGGIIYTVGFTFSNQSFNDLATDSSHALLATNDTQLKEAMDGIATNITAMILDPMGSNVALVPGSASASGITDGVLNATASQITWYPGTTQINSSHNSVTLTYKVKLKDGALTPGEHTNVPLNTDALLQYRVKNSGSEGKAISAAFPLPKAAYDVGTLNVQYRNADTGETIAELPADATKTVITDWGTPAFDVGLAPASVEKSANQTWFYQSSKLDSDDKYADNSASIAATVGEHTLIRYYKLQNSYTVHYAYTDTTVPDGANAQLPGDASYAEGTRVDVAAEPKLSAYEFSGWSTKDAEIKDGKFTLNRDVTLTGSWEEKASYEVVANFFTSTDGGAPVQDNAEPVPVKSTSYGDYTAYQPAQKQSYEGGQYDLAKTTHETTGKHTVITLEYTRSAATEVAYQVVHEYYTRTDGVLSDTAEHISDPVKLKGSHNQTITAASQTLQTGWDGKTYEKLDDTGDIILDKKAAKTQQIVIRYVRDRYTVTTSVDENGTIKPATAAYDAGRDVSVSWSAKSGYHVASVTVDGKAYTGNGPVEFNALAAAHSVAVTTAPNDYKLTINYVFSDGSTHPGFTNGTDGKTYHITDGYSVTAPDAPAGYTFNPTASGALSGTFGAGDVTVTLHYTANGSVSAVVHFYEEGKTTDLRETMIGSGLVEQNYDLSAAQNVTEINVDGKWYDYVDDNKAAYTGTLPENGVVIERYYTARPTYTVTYAPGAHGTFEEQSYSGLYATPAAKTPAFAGEKTCENGWVFKDWSPAVSENVTGDVTYTAQWKELPKLTVVYEFYTSTNGGAYVKSGEKTVLDAQYIQTGAYSHTAPDQYSFTDSNNVTFPYTRSGDAKQSGVDADYGSSYKLVFRFERQHSGAVNYTVKHVYRTLLGDSNTVTQDGFTNVSASGTYQDTVLATDIAQQPGYQGGEYVFNADASDKSIVLDGSENQTITLVYDRHKYTVAVEGDAGVKSTSGAGNYLKGSLVNVTYTLNTGYALDSITVNDVAATSATVKNLTKDTTVKLTTKQVEYTVTYFVDGTQYGEVETYHYGDKLSLRNFPAAPVGKHFSGWSPALPDTMPADHLKLYGSFVSDEYKVSYLPGDHGTFKQQNYPGLHYEAATPTFEGTPTGQENWVFSGWSPEVSEKVTGSVNYTAQWKLAQYTLVVKHEDREKNEANAEYFKPTSNPYDVGTQSTAAPLATLPSDYKLIKAEADLAGAVTFDSGKNATINSDKAQTITVTYTYGLKSVAYVNVNYILTDGTKDKDGKYIALKTLGSDTANYRENDNYDVTALVNAFSAGHSMYAKMDSDALTGKLSGTETATVNVYYTAKPYSFTVRYRNGYTNQDITPTEGLTVSAQAPYGTELTEELVAGALRVPGWRNAMRPSGYSDGAVQYVTIGTDAGKNVVVVTYNYTPPYIPDGPSDTYYRVTVRYLEQGTDKVLAQEYTSDAILSGTRYDVSTQAALEISGYTIARVDGETAGALNRNVTVIVYYTTATEIPDENTPTGDKPEIPGDVEIPDENTPTGGEPEIPGGDVEIVDGDVPLGNLPQTGTVGMAVENRWTIGLLAVLSSMAAAGLAVTISRKKKEDEEI